MRPTLTESDIIVYRPATFAELKVGDVVIFEAGEKASLKCSTCVVSIFAHRITAKHERSVETKGDANQREDEHPISQADIKGLIVYAIDGQTGIVRELN
jgi:signal peptidase I